jgi:protein gp37
VAGGTYGPRLPNPGLSRQPPAVPRACKARDREIVETEMTQSKIEWCDRSDWNPLRGCTRVSPGCGGPGPHGGCYAEAIAARFSDPGQPFHGFAERTQSGPRWTGKVELIEERLTAPLRWRKPARIFALSMSDLFHESVPDEWIDRIFAVMALCPQHTFQVLSKRAERMRDYIESRGQQDSYGSMDETLRQIMDEHHIPPGTWLGRWPLPNVWLGVSCEDQRRADERIPLLLDTPAIVRWLSIEPMLGPVDLNPCSLGPHGISWTVAGGESGRSARPMHPAWARALRDQCVAAGVPFFFKQWGEWEPLPEGQAPERYDSDRLHFVSDAGNWMLRVGKRSAGRVLDGQCWDEYPR